MEEYREMSINIKTPAVDYFFDAVLSLKNREECYNFFEDICTPQEIANMDQRIQCAIMLKQGKTYAEIIEKTGISSATLSRISKCMQHSNGGFSALLNRYVAEKRR